MTLKNGDLIFRCQFGSHVYGTNLPTSDMDYKAVFIPDSRDLILQRAPKHIQNNTKLDPNAKNSSEDIDDESFSIQQYLKLLCEGQTVALDMLFCPKEFWTSYGHGWKTILDNKEKFLHKGTSAFVGYTKQQAAKYGVKGFRVNALKTTLDFLSGYDESLKLRDVAQLATFVELQHNEFIGIVQCKGPNGELSPHLEVCNRKVPLHASVEYAKEVFGKIYDNYGARARMAEANEGVDFKALMHAVRVAREAEELLLTGNITFPRPEKDLLLKIRKGEMEYKQIEPIIEEGLIRIEEAQSKSILPAKPDFKFVDDLVYEIHSEQINKARQYKIYQSSYK